MSLTLKSQDLTHTDKIWCVDYNKTKSIVATCGADNQLIIYKPDLSKILLQKCLKDQHNNRSLRRVSFSPCGNFLAVCSFDTTTSLWKILLENSELKLEFWQLLEGHENEVKSISWSINGQYLATCSRDKNVWIWELFDEAEFDCAAVLSGHSQDVKDVSFSKTHTNILASSSYDGTVRIWEEHGENTGDWEETATISVINDGTVWGVAFFDETEDVFNKEYRLVICCIDDGGNISIYGNLLEDTSEWELITKLKLTSDFQEEVVIYSLKVDCSSKITVACNDNSLRIFKYNENRSISEVLHEEQAHLDDLNDVCCNGEEVYSVGDDKSLKFWVKS